MNSDMLDGLSANRDHIIRDPQTGLEVNMKVFDALIDELKKSGLMKDEAIAKAFEDLERRKEIVRPKYEYGTWFLVASDAGKNYDIFELMEKGNGNFENNDFLLGMRHKKAYIFKMVRATPLFVQKGDVITHRYRYGGMDKRDYVVSGLDWSETSGNFLLELRWSDSFNYDSRKLALDELEDLNSPYFLKDEI